MYNEDKGECPLHYQRMSYEDVRDRGQVPYLLGGRQQPRCRACNSRAPWAHFCSWDYSKFSGCSQSSRLTTSCTENKLFVGSWSLAPVFGKGLVSEFPGGHSDWRRHSRGQFLRREEAELVGTGCAQVSGARVPGVAAGAAADVDD